MNLPKLFFQIHMNSGREMKSFERNKTASSRKLQMEDRAMTRPIINRDPDILGGTPVFMGTRVPIKALFDYLEAGDNLDEFLDGFPSVRKEQALVLLELARHNLVGVDETFT